MVRGVRLTLAARRPAEELTGPSPMTHEVELDGAVAAGRPAAVPAASAGATAIEHEEAHRRCPRAGGHSLLECKEATKQPREG